MNSDTPISLAAYLSNTLSQAVLRARNSIANLRRRIEQPKLYILIREDLDPQYQSVQAGHATVQFLLENPEDEWKNHTLIYLGVSGPNELDQWKWRLKTKNIPFSEFNEPDLNGQTTAIAVRTDQEQIFENLPLMGEG